MATFDLVILLVYIALILGIGIWVSRGQHSTEAYFLAGRNMPWWAVGMSMFASLTSAVTFMGLPGIAYGGNIALLVVPFVSLAIAPVLMFVVYPVYSRLGVTTSYDYIALRFGEAPRKVVAGLFLLARLGWLGTVIFAPALALSLATGFPTWQCILLIGVLATVYTVFGGMKAVIWTDVIQFVILAGGAVWIMVSLLGGIDAGLAGIWEAHHQAGRPGLTFSWSWTEMTVGAVFLHFFLQMTQDYGTDQVTVQRLLSTRSLGGLRRAIAFNAGTDLVIITLLIFIGLGLYALNQGVPGSFPDDLSRDQILPYYIIHNLPTGVSGLMIAAIFAAAMSSVDSGINSMAAVTIHDVLKKDSLDGGRFALVPARVCTLVFGTLATGVAFYAQTIDSIIEAFVHFMSLFSAPVLALFMAGFLFPRVQFRHWLPGLAVSIPATLALQHGTSVSWVFYFPSSFLICFVFSLSLSYLFPAISAETTGDE
jgi:SSS family transporter